jgi:hypothetical protein
MNVPHTLAKLPWRPADEARCRRLAKLGLCKFHLWKLDPISHRASYFAGALPAARVRPA